MRLAHMFKALNLHIKLISNSHHNTFAITCSNNWRVITYSINLEMNDSLHLAYFCDTLLALKLKCHNLYVL